MALVLVLVFALEFELTFGGHERRPHVVLSVNFTSSNQFVLVDTPHTIASFLLCRAQSALAELALIRVSKIRILPMSSPIIVFSAIPRAWDRPWASFNMALMYCRYALYERDVFRLHHMGRITSSWTNCRRAGSSCPSLCWALASARTRSSCWTSVRFAWGHPLDLWNDCGHGMSDVHLDFLSPRDMSNWNEGSWTVRRNMRHIHAMS